MPKKSIIIGITIAVVCLGSFVACDKNNEYAQQQYEFDTSTNDKPIGENLFKEMASYYIIPASFDDLLLFADIVVEGEVISEGVLAYDGWPKVPGTHEDDPINIKDKVAVTLTKFKVDRVLYGELDTEVITIYQYGPPKTNVGEIKVKEGQKLICFLFKADNNTQIENEPKNLYASVQWESGFYDISDENKSMAFSNINGLCRFDNKPSREMIKEIENAIGRFSKK